MSIAQNIIKIKSELPPDVNLVAVSKFKPNEDILEAYNAGQRDFAESRPQELSAKIKELPQDILWHFIGHLQTNKIKMILPGVHLIHSVDSERLLVEINKFCEKNNIVAECLLQLYIASEESKQGMDSVEIIDILSRKDQFKSIRFRGLMGMASLTNDEQQIRREFLNLKTVFEQLKLSEGADFNTLSMGMSDDYLIAIECGGNMVRIGSKIFGSRY